MGIAWITSLSLILVILLIQACKAADVYTAVGPKLVRPHTVYNLTIRLEKEASRPITFNVSIRTLPEPVRPWEGDREVKIIKLLFQSEKVTIVPGTFQRVGIQIGDLPEDKYNLTISGEAEEGEVNLEDSSVIYRSKNNKVQSLLIQTDKPIYKPGETVKFRVIMLDRFLRLLTAQLVDISILDPQRNVIKNWKKEKLENGLLASELSLSTEPNLGEWTLQASSNGETVTMTFSVDQYVLPKFKVDVVLPPFLTYNNTKFNAEVKAAYTYGKPMKGECEVRLTEVWTYGHYYRNTEQKVVAKRSAIEGSAFFEFDLVQELENGPVTSEKEYQVDASVTDALTGRQHNGTARIKIYAYPYKIDIIEESSNFKPGLPLTLTFKVTSQDGVSISDPDPKAIKIAHGFAYLAEDGVQFLGLPPTGIVSIQVTTPSNDLIRPDSIEVSYKDLTRTFRSPPRLNSPSKTYMDIILDTKSPQVNTELGVTVKLNKAFDSLNFVLYGRGQVVQSESVTLPEPSKEHTFKVLVTSSAAPEATLLVYTVIKPTHEVAVESVKFSLNSVFDNFLNLTLSKDVAEPGENLSISLTTTAGSVIALRGVDQSVLLLKEDKDITVKTIEAEVESFQENMNDFRLYGGSSAFQTFEQTGLVILTNAVLEKERYVQPEYYPDSGTDMDEDMVYYSMPESIMVDDMEPVSSGGQSPRVRKDFPETWLWETVHTNASNYIMNKVVPDTLTSWVISGFALSSDTGIGVTLTPSVLKTFRSFFVTLNKPYSIVAGEIFGLQVLVHNYMKNGITATVTLQNSDDAFEFHEGKSKNLPELSKSIALGPVEVKSLTFVIKPTKFGIMKLDVKAVSPLAGDAVSQTLIVKPPGQKQTRNKAVLLDLRNVTSVKQELAPTFPPRRVEGADLAKISVISDLLASTISNLDKLLQMPCGCGEQNMLNFVPDIVILDYLTASGTLTPEIKHKALRFLEAGYQRELTYRHSDGSFSAFGKSDPQGSTWLTAFVVRSFVAAKPHITIDNSIIGSALLFLAQKQRADGSFVELGTVLDQKMKGGATDTYSLSAYVLLAFVEGANQTEGSNNFGEVIRKGMEYISTAPTSMENPYPLTLITYALQAAGHDLQGSFQTGLEQLAKNEGDLLYWEPPKANKTNDRWEPSTKPISVEMTAYALLIYLKENNLEKALSVGKWLLQQRNAEGGFISTQDTVVGLTALGKFALTTKAAENDLLIKATHEGGTQVFSVNDDNAIVLQESILPSTVQAVTFEATGKGTALVQLSWSYFVEDKSEAPAFSVDIEVVSAPKASSMVLKICTAYSKPDSKNKESNMAVMEVNLPSGYAFDTAALGPVRSVSEVKRYELEDADSKLNIYFNFLSTVSRCVSLPADRVFKVANPAPAYVSVYDYYDTTRKARAFYSPPGFSACDICKDEESCTSQNCVSVPAVPFSKYEVFGPKVEI